MLNGTIKLKDILKTSTYIFVLFLDQDSIHVSVYSDGSGSPALPYRFAINGVPLDSDLPESINDDGIHILEIPGDKPPVYYPNNTLNIAASTTQLTVCDKTFYPHHFFSISFPWIHLKKIILFVAVSRGYDTCFSVKACHGLYQLVKSIGSD